jgi:hypothetical protein
MVQAREIKKFLKLDGSACSVLKQKYKKLFYRFLQFFLSMCDHGPVF